MGINNIPKIHLYSLLAAWVFVHVGLIVHLGVRDNLFDAAGYIRSAEFLISNGRLSDLRQIFYVVPIALLALFRLFSDGIYLFVLTQIILSGLAAIALYRSAAKLFDSAASGLLAAMVYLCWWDNIQWNTVVMTDSLAVSLSCFILHQLVFF